MALVFVAGKDIIFNLHCPLAAVMFLQRMVFLHLDNGLYTGILAHSGNDLSAGHHGKLYL